MEWILIICVIVLFITRALARNVERENKTRNIWPELKERDSKITFSMKIYHESNEFLVAPRTYYYLKGDDDEEILWEPKDTDEPVNFILPGTEESFHRVFHSFLHNKILNKSATVNCCDLDIFKAKCEAQFKEWAVEIDEKGLDKVD